MAQWARDWGGLDDDILIELYPLAEPRQYTKNITSAALFYGKLYYGISAKDMLDFLYGVKPLPQQAVPAGVTGQTVTATTPESSSSGTADGASSSSATTGSTGGAPSVTQGSTAGTAAPASATPSETLCPPRTPQVRRLSRPRPSPHRGLRHRARQLVTEYLSLTPPAGQGPGAAGRFTVTS